MGQDVAMDTLLFTTLVDPDSSSFDAVSSQRFGEQVKEVTRRSGYAAKWHASRLPMDGDHSRKGPANHSRMLSCFDQISDLRGRDAVALSISPVPRSSPLTLAC